MKIGFAKTQYDAIVVGSGPNGLSCAISLAQKGLSVVVTEKSELIGGGARTLELTLPGFHHDICSAVHPLAVASPFFKTLPLAEHGLRWIFPQAQLAHPFDDGSVYLLKKSVHETASGLGRDQQSYQRLFDSLTSRFDELMEEVLEPALHMPRHLSLLAKFGINALLSARHFVNCHFREEKTKALCLGIAAHSSAPLTGAASAAPGLVLQVAGHGEGWPIPQGGAQSITNALASYFRSLGGEIVAGFEVQDIGELPKSQFIFFDLTPRQILRIAEAHLPRRVASAFKHFRQGPGVFKLDWALGAPIPWKNPDCALSATVHLGGSGEELIMSEKYANEGTICPRPFVLVSQPTLFDPSRAPMGQHIAWAYCHVPQGSSYDMTEIIEGQIERFAPGFKKTIIKRSALFPLDLEKRNPNLIGGDISGGLVNIKQLLFRPRVTPRPYALDGSRLWICSSSTPPGPGVHGMSGYHAAQAACRLMGFAR